MIFDEAIIIVVVSLLVRQRIRRRELLLFVPLFRRTNSVFSNEMNRSNRLFQKPDRNTNRMENNVLPLTLETYDFHFQSIIIIYIKDLPSPIRKIFMTCNRNKHSLYSVFSFYLFVVGSFHQICPQTGKLDLKEISFLFVH